MHRYIHAIYLADFTMYNIVWLSYNWSQTVFLLLKRVRLYCFQKFKVIYPYNLYCTVYLVKEIWEYHLYNYVANYYLT